VSLYPENIAQSTQTVLKQARSTRKSRVNSLLKTRCYVAREDNSNEKASISPFPGKAGTENQIKQNSDELVPVNTVRRVLGLRMEERPLIWREAANILKKLSHTADKG